MLEKMSRDTLANPSLPLVSFGDTVTYPPPQECHVLFEWTLRALYIFWYIPVTISYDPCISRIDKIFLKFCPKFLNLYASKYGRYFLGRRKFS